MHIPLITGFYAGLLGLVFLWLTARVGQVRKRTGIALMDGGNREMIVALRGQGNFVELVPYCLILMTIVELAATSAYLMHAMGIILLISRIVHPFGLDPERMTTWQRGAGAGGTILVLLAASIWAIYLFVVRHYLAA